MADVKSAYEIAMEKIKDIEPATLEERQKWKFVPKGEELAAKYMKDDVNLMTELSKYNDEERKYVVQGVSAILIRNIDLPKTNSCNACDSIYDPPRCIYLFASRWRLQFKHSNIRNDFLLFPFLSNLKS